MRFRKSDGGSWILGGTDKLKLNIRSLEVLYGQLLQRILVDARNTAEAW